MARWLLVTLLLLPASASAQYFSQNKVQYREFDFKVLRTAHFDIYFRVQVDAWILRTGSAGSAGSADCGRFDDRREARPAEACQAATS